MIDDDPQLLTRVAMTHSTVLFWGLARDRDAFDVVGSAVAALRGDVLRDQLIAHRAALRLFAGNVDEARLDAEHLLHDDQDAEVRRNALSTAITAWGLQGKVVRASTAADENMALALDGDDPSRAGEYAIGKCVAQVLCGDLAGAAELADTAYGMAMADRAVDYAGVWQLLRGRISMSCGSLLTAEERLREASDLLRRHDTVSFEAWALALLATVQAQLGDLDGAARSLAACERATNPAVHVYDCDVGLARAWVAHTRGEASHARRIASAAADAAMQAGVLLGAVTAWHDLARLGAAADAIQPLSDLATDVDGPLATACAQHARALAFDDADGLHRASAAFEAFGALLLAAEAETHAAAAHRRAVCRGSHLRSAARVADLLERCEGTTPVLRSSTEPEQLASLTQREREVVGLVRRGLTNREIAQRLWLSVRTVGNHLNHAYAKLGVSDRVELRAVAPLVEDVQARSDERTLVTQK